MTVGKRLLLVVSLPVLMIVFFALLTGASICWISRQRKKYSQAVVESLQGYKQANHRYPLTLAVLMTSQVPEWIYYLPDSSGQSFTLAYVTDIMNCNAYIYLSSTQTWKEQFAY